jgi:hypothetical protein
MDYGTSTCTVTNIARGTTKDIRIVEGGFKLPGDNVLIISDEQVNKWRGELCGG